MWAGKANKVVAFDLQVLADTHIKKISKRMHTPFTGETFVLHLLGNSWNRQNSFKDKKNTDLPAKSTKLIRDVLAVSSPASFFLFCTNFTPTIVCARLKN